ncbi:MAG TPA: tetratricopeptide repeat protein, partial [Acidimicrobiales bacterium]|nr:tetratricopeptide repeat protein [Acidimicrobiales bacterium]
MGEVATGAPFVGEGRRQLLAALQSRFDAVVTDRTPRWISLEAPTGWGKTRLAQELYRTLARDHQDDGAYWPASIVEMAAEPVADPVRAIGLERKQTHPAVLDPAPQSTPAWVWWGISCSARFGAPTEALASDIAQLRILAPDLEKRWRRKASRLRRARKQLAGKRSELVDTSIGEAVGVAASLANVAVPGLGFLLAAVKWTAAGVANRMSEQEDRGDLREIQSKDLIDEVAAGLPQIAREIVPAVVFVEDVHLADEGLTEVLARILSSQDCPVLVVTSSWPGTLERADRPARLLFERVPEERTERWTNEGPAASLDEIAVEERLHLVEALAPELFAEAQEVLAERFRTPLALRLACGSARLRRANTPERALTVARSLPAEVARLYEEWWEELPVQVQRACMLASLASLAGVSPAIADGDDRWDTGVVVDAVRSVDWLADEVGDISGVDRDASVHQWVRTVDEWLRRFHEPDQFDIARRKAESHWPDRADLADFYRAIVQAVQWDGVSDERSVLQARLIVAAEAEGLIDRDEQWEAAVVRSMRHLASQPDTASLRQARSIFDRATPHLSELALLETREITADVAYGLGRYAEALTLGAEALRSRLRLLPPTDPGTLLLRRNTARWTAAAGRIPEAIDELQGLLADQSRVMGPDAPDTLATRAELAHWLGRAGRVGEALEQFDALLEDQRRVLGPHSRASLSTRGNAATCAA